MTENSYPKEYPKEGHKGKIFNHLNFRKKFK